MNKHNFIQMLIDKFISNKETKQAEITISELEKFLSPYLDFDDLYEKLVTEWQKSTMPPIAWLKDKSHIHQDYRQEAFSEQKYWMIRGVNEAGTKYDFWQPINWTLDQAKLGLTQRGLKYVSNNRQEIIGS